jgi:hypothetical protein
VLKIMQIRQILSAAIVGAAALSGSALAQVTSVGQLRDVQPTEWSYQAIKNLVEKYGVVAGFPDGTFRSNKPASRAELAALTSAALDQITRFYTEDDARLAASLRQEFSGEIAKTNTRVTALEVAAARRAEGVGNYVGLGVILNRQGISGNGYDEDRTVGGATLQGRYVATRALGGEISIRPYLSAVGTPAGEIGAGGGAAVTYDWSVASRKLADGSRVSAANVYGGVGYQVPFVNNTDANYQSAVGDRGQVVGVVGIEGRISNSLVGWADLKLPTTNATVEVNGRRGAYSPVFTTGLGIKF